MGLERLRVLLKQRNNLVMAFFLSDLFCQTCFLVDPEKSYRLNST